MFIRENFMKKDNSVVYDGKPKTTSKWLIVLIIVLAVIFTVLPIAGVIYAIVEDSSIVTEFERNDNDEVLLKKNIVISNETGIYNEDDGTYYIQGYLQNNSEDNLNYARIEYFVYDKNNNLLGTADCTITNLKQNIKWKYKATYYSIDSSEISKFELSRVELY